MHSSLANCAVMQKEVRRTLLRVLHIPYFVPLTAVNKVAHMGTRQLRNSVFKRDRRIFVIKFSIVTCVSYKQGKSFTIFNVAVDIGLWLSNF